MYIIFVFFYFHVACNCSNSLNKKLKGEGEKIKSKEIKGEKYQLDSSKLLMSSSDCFFKPVKILWSVVTQKKQKNKSKKRFEGSTEKYLKIEEYLNIYVGSYMREINIQNALEYS